MVKVSSCWSGWCRSGWVGLVRASQGGEGLWLGCVGWVVGLGWVVGWGWIRLWVGGSGVRMLQGRVSTMGKKNKCSNENEFILYHN